MIIFSDRPASEVKAGLERLKKALAYFKKIPPKRIEMGTWVEDGTNRCNTTACFCGHAAVAKIDPGFKYNFAYGITYKGVGKYAKTFDSFDAVQEVFAMREEVALKIFDHFDYSDSASAAKTKKRVIQRVEAYIKIAEAALKAEKDIIT